MKKFLASILIFIVPILLGANYRTANFMVDAPSQQLSQSVALQAEKSRKELAILWLGHELQQWKQPCPVRVTVAQHGGGGATSFGFGGGEPSISMHVEGRIDKILSDVIPHEVFHTILATYFKRPTARWVDEGASVCAEGMEEQEQQNRTIRSLLNSGRAMQLKRLFGLKDYPQGEIQTLYSQGHSVTRYLILLKGRGNLISFIWHGQQRGWDEAVNVCYGLNGGVAELEKNWLNYLKETKGKPLTEIPLLKANEAPQHPTKDYGNGVIVQEFNPQSSPGSSSAPPKEEIFQTLSRLEQKIDSVLAIKQDVEDLKKRMLAAEAEIARLKGQKVGQTTSSEGVISDIPGWNYPRSGTIPTKQVQPTFAQPVPWVPQQSYNQQPFCPPGRQ